MSDEDDFITVNITCDQAGAVAHTLLLAQQAGLLSILPRWMQTSLRDFVGMMEMEIENQKMNTNNNH